MSDSNEHAGFSFQISETPPPARANGRTPLAELELEMSDFGDAPEPSPLPPREPRAVPSAWLDEPVPPAPSAIARDRLEPSTGIEERNAAQEAPETAPRPSDEVAKDDPPEGAREARPQEPPLVPRIKKISFPAAPAPRQKRKGETKPGRVKTKFSQSIGAEQPRKNLDSEPELVTRGDAPEPQLAAPEDLPGAEESLAPPQADSAGWNTDTPSAREIWRRARGTWQAASRQAVALSGQGLRAGRALAESMNDKVKERLREASEERAAQAKLREEAPQVGENLEAPASPPGPSVAGKMILGLARSAGRKVAAPASALAAAGAVYFAGSHLVGADASVALSKAVQGPEIPELGTLENREPSPDPGKKGDAAGGDSGPRPPKTEKASQSGPPPMQTEVTEMPQGMSWPGKGLIEVVTSQDELVYVDGVFTGRGPLRRIPVSPGEHEVSIRADGKERKGSVEVQANKNTRAVFKSE